MRRSGQPQTRRLFGWMAIGAVAYHASAMAVLHVLAPEVDPVTDTVGAYLASPYTLLARSTFLALGCALAFLGLGLADRVTGGATARLAMGLLVVAIAGFLAVAAVPGAARIAAIPTRPGTLVSILLLSTVLHRQTPWKRVGPVLLLIATALMALLILAVAPGPVHAGYGGLVNRVVLALIYSWVVLAAAGTLRVLPAQVQAAPPGRNSVRTIVGVDGGRHVPPSGHAGRRHD